MILVQDIPRFQWKVVCCVSSNLPVLDVSVCHTRSFYGFG